MCIILLIWWVFFSAAKTFSYSKRVRKHIFNSTCSQIKLDFVTFYHNIEMNQFNYFFLLLIVFYIIVTQNPANHKGNIVCIKLDIPKNFFFVFFAISWYCCHIYEYVMGLCKNVFWQWPYCMFEWIIKSVD